MYGIRPHKRISLEESEERRRLATRVHITAEAIADAFSIPLELLLGRESRQAGEAELRHWAPVGSSSGIGRRWPYQGRF